MYFLSEVVSTVQFEVEGVSGMQLRQLRQQRARMHIKQRPDNITETEHIENIGFYFHLMLYLQID